ncbi:hypothetical protein ACQ4PT_042475 [Festuca glaucescens]
MGKGEEGERDPLFLAPTVIQEKDDLCLQMCRCRDMEAGLLMLLSSGVGATGCCCTLVNSGDRVLLDVRESNITKERFDKVLKAGSNVVFTTRGIDDMSLKLG